MGQSHSVQNKSHGYKKSKTEKIFCFVLHKVEIRRYYRRISPFMWLFSRALALWRTFVRRREPNHAFCIRMTQPLSACVFRFPKGLFLKSPFGAVWSAQLHKNGVFLFGVGTGALDDPFLLRLYAQKKKRVSVNFFLYKYVKCS